MQAYLAASIWMVIAYADNGWKQYVPVKEETKTVKKIRIIS